MSDRARFWLTAAGTAGAVAGGTAGGVPLLLRLELRDPALVWLLRPHEIWLLAVFTEGVLAVLLGGAVSSGWLRGARGLRDRLEARGRGEPPHGGAREVGSGRAARPALWVMAVGGWLLGIYFVGWLVLGGV